MDTKLRSPVVWAGPLEGDTLTCHSQLVNCFCVYVIVPCLELLVRPAQLLLKMIEEEE